MVQNNLKNSIFSSYFNNLETEDEFDEKILEKYDLTIDDFIKEEPKERKLGWINKNIWFFRNWTKSQLLKDVIDAYLVGGMTSEEQEHYLPYVNKDPIKLSRRNAYIDFGLTVFLSSVPYLTDIILKKNTNYEGNAGSIMGFTAITQSFVIAAYRVGYIFVKKKPIESFSILSLMANSTTYIKQTDGLRELLNELYPSNFEFEKTWGYESLKEINFDLLDKAA
jgi:hypothetical protein